MVTRTTWRRTGLPLLPGLALLGGVAPVSAKPAWTSGTFVYADLCTLPESGTLAGQRVTLRRSPNGDGLTYEGAGMAPAAGAMTLDDDTKALAFTVETEAGPLRFRGSATTDALTGVFADAGGSYPVRLPRVLRSHADRACPGETTGSIGARR